MSDTKLPVGRSCEDCHNFSHCTKMYGVKAHYTTCALSPSRFSLSYFNLFERTAAERDKLKEINADLLKALKLINRSFNTQRTDIDCGTFNNAEIVIQSVRDCIAKADAS